MSSRIFQSVVLQMKDSTERAIGVIDSEGTVVACNELSCIGEHWPGAVDFYGQEQRISTDFLAAATHLNKEKRSFHHDSI